MTRRMESIMEALAILALIVSMISIGIAYDTRSKLIKYQSKQIQVNENLIQFNIE